MLHSHRPPFVIKFILHVDYSSMFDVIVVNGMPCLLSRLPASSIHSICVKMRVRAAYILRQSFSSGSYRMTRTNLLDEMCETNVVFINWVHRMPLWPYGLRPYRFTAGDDIHKRKNSTHAATQDKSVALFARKCENENVWPE